MAFRDGTEQWHTAFADQYDSTRDVTYHEDVPLSQFFSRPIKVASYTWSTADVTPLFQTIDPWSLFFTNPRVANRITNFQNFSGNLHVKFVMNGNSFLYGRLMADYFPLRAYDTISDTTGTNVLNAIQASQRLHIYLDPCESQAGEMTLPFIWYYDKVNLTKGEYSSLGTLYLRQLQALKHANAATGDVTITMFVWATNVKLSIPTVHDITGITAQSGTFDEYGTGPVSSMAAAIASAAGRLVTMPVIGRYARATSMMSSAIGKVAALFGFSRPAVISDYSDMRPQYISRIAVTNGGDNVAKLTVEAKQELTIDPTVVGLQGNDELTIHNLVSKESYITQFPWTVARVANDLLWSSRVGPLWAVLGSSFYFPAMTYATLPFKYWRGSMIYRFQVVASGYHKGRLLVVWDPFYQITGAETNVQYSKIIDLADERDFTFEVGWGNSQAWCETQEPSGTQPFRTIAFPGDSSNNSYNGVISVYVLNELTVPNVTVNNDININVSIRACDDWKVAVPTGAVIARLAPESSIVPQSGAFEEVSTDEKNAPRIETVKETIAMCEPVVDSTDLVYFGENVVSYRQLMKRYTLWSSLGTGVAAPAGGATLIKMPDFPPNRGYSAFGAVANGANNFNPSNTTILNYLGYAFMAFRGGIRWKVVVSDTLPENAQLISVARSALLNDYTGPYQSTIPEVLTTPYAYSVNRVVNTLDTFHSGGHLTISKQPVLEFETPYYQRRRFSSTRNLGGKATFAADDLAHRIVACRPTGSIQTFDMFVAGAEDATFIGFQGAPPLKLTTI